MYHGEKKKKNKKVPEMRSNLLKIYLRNVFRLQLRIMDMEGKNKITAL